MTDRHPNFSRSALEVRSAAIKCQINISPAHCDLLTGAALDALPKKEWYAVAAKQFQENTAAQQLREQGFTVFRPKVFHHPDDDGFETYGAMDYRIPGYVFVLLDLRAGEHVPVGHTKGVEELVRGADGGERKPIALPPGAVETLRKFEDEDFARATLKRPDRREDLYEGCEVLVDDKDNRAYGKTGILMSLTRKKGSVLIGAFQWEADAIFLKKVEKPKKIKAAKRIA